MLCVKHGNLVLPLIMIVSAHLPVGHITLFDTTVLSKQLGLPALW